MLCAIGPQVGSRKGLVLELEAAAIALTAGTLLTVGGLMAVGVPMTAGGTSTRVASLASCVVAAPFCFLWDFPWSARRLRGFDAGTTGSGVVVLAVP